MHPQENQLTIGRLTATVGINVETFRFYQRRGLLRELPRPLGGIRHYAKDILDLFIHSFSIRESIDLPGFHKLPLFYNS
ncbi:MerR family DNA-binding transcriptional regulator [Acidithiobacillus ferrooxidans]|nr:MerR family DNA-binding transcriptional regulator [Acidithiobacillus ferrooxidans]MBU2860074.1 MerR family DNA-binding transcriptional regulator [Acidithiobacillus ferrooxidans]